MDTAVSATACAEIYDLLYALGAAPSCTGFFLAADAIQIAMNRPESLSAVTKNLYPAVAAHYQTSWTAVERNIRTVIGRVWTQNPGLLCRIAGFPMDRKPRPAEFIFILSVWLRQAEAGSA